MAPLARGKGTCGRSSGRGSSGGDESRTESPTSAGGAQLRPCGNRRGAHHGVPGVPSFLVVHMAHRCGTGGKVVWELKGKHQRVPGVDWAPEGDSQQPIE